MKFEDLDSDGQRQEIEGAAEFEKQWQFFCRTYNLPDDHKAKKFARMWYYEGRMYEMRTTLNEIKKLTNDND